ncbi:epsin-2 isoform X2 [Lepeophtheirus salmonis]|uniref:epsin-2 isoform X2 n=1 Tax=Lepeophtheirus salmonis TaxID=72036 RepID=UPI003AF3EE69
MIPLQSLYFPSLKVEQFIKFENMAVNISGLRRNIKNVACSYSPAQVKVREATSNDPWGPSSTMMSEVADLTYNIAAFSDVMQMIWKRLNDQGKNWRHVYKALVLLEYLLKTGCDKVIEESKMNLFIIKSLIDFQYLDDNKDQGINVREKAKSLVTLLKDDELLKSERVKALKSKFNTTREKHQASRWMRNSQSMIETSLSELEDDRPHTKGEEDLQLELALAMSRGDVDDDECDQDSQGENPIRRNYSEDFKFVSHKSENDIEGLYKANENQTVQNKSSLFDLVDLEFDPTPLSGNASGLQGSAFTTTASIYKCPNSISPPTASLGGIKSVSLDPLCISTPNVSIFDRNKGLDPWGNQCSPPHPPTRFDSAIDVFNPRDEGNLLPSSSKPSKAEATTSGSMTNSFDPWETSFGDKGEGTICEDPFSTQSQNILADFDNIRHDVESSILSGEDSKNDPFIVQLDPSSTSPQLKFETTAVCGADGGDPFQSSFQDISSHKHGVGSILNEHQNLVDLDNWSPFGGKNPFELKPTNPFQPAKQSTPMKQLAKDNINQLDNSHYPKNHGNQQQQQQLPHTLEDSPFF